MPASKPCKLCEREVPWLFLGTIQDNVRLIGWWEGCPDFLGALHPADDRAYRQYLQLNTIDWERV